MGVFSLSGMMGEPRETLHDMSEQFLWAARLKFARRKKTETQNARSSKCALRVHKSSWFQTFLSRIRPLSLPDATLFRLISFYLLIISLPLPRISFRGDLLRPGYRMIDKFAFPFSRRSDRPLVEFAIFLPYRMTQRSHVMIVASMEILQLRVCASVLVS